MITQIELEQEMYDFGRSRAARIIASNEEGGRAISNPYSQAVMRRFVLPLAEIIREDIATKKAGRRKAHVVMLEGMDPEAIAYLSVRALFNAILSGVNTSGREIVSQVGKSAYHELCLSLFSEASPELFYTLVNDLDRRLSKSERHRMTVFKMQAKANDVPWAEWGTDGIQQVGAYLIDQLEQLGMVVTEQINGSGPRAKSRVEINLAPGVADLIGGIREHIIETMPYFLPCVEQPMDWVGMSDGGFHTKEMRRMAPYVVRSRMIRRPEDFRQGDMAVPLAAINALQRTPWQINGPMLDAIRDVSKHYDMEEILSQAEFPAPPKPEWLGEDMKTEDMSATQMEQFVGWKREKSEWFTQMKLRGTKYGRFYTATTVADKFREFPAIYFVYFADFRGRLYAQTTGVSPQGSDMQKALLRFATGKPLATPDAIKWFCIHGANKWGFDKESLADRAEWHVSREQQLMDFAADPINNRGWQEADTPLQFLAWCQEYRAWRLDPASFVSHLPIGMDGTCNGLQNFSAMLRDAVGGKATNLVPADKPSDIYQMVAERTLERLLNCRPQENLVVMELGTDGKRVKRDANEDEKAASLAQAERFKAMWIKHGMNRTLVKRSVMTLPYGSTRFSCADFIVSDYLRMGKAPEFEKTEYRAAAQWLSHFVWESIGDVVVKAREAMTWLQQSTKDILNTNDDIRWVSPSGFPVVQGYVESNEHRIRTQLCGSAFLRTHKETDVADRNRHKNGVAPNFIHSYDAAHLQLVAVAAFGEGMDLAMIHDDYGTHAADAQRFYDIIREQFVGMYESFDPLQDFSDRYALGDPPTKGSLDLRLVLESPYFFS